MTLEEKVSKTLEGQSVADGESVLALFAEVRERMEAERREVISRGVVDEAERNKVCKALRDRWLARKNGLLAQIDKHWLKPASPDLKPVVGREFNQLRQAAHNLETTKLVEAVHLMDLGFLNTTDQPVPTLQYYSEAAPAESGVTEPVLPLADATPLGKRRESPRDLTLPGYRRPLGSLHPITRVQRELEDIFLSLGFSIETGPEVESVYYNFDALNIPENHPARDDMDSLYVDSNTVLRTHTSPVQIRAMEKRGAPLYIIVPGKVYRRDDPDATHSPMFHQIEGLAIDTDITFADLKGTLDFFAKKFFGEKIRTSFHPTFFPFTEPSGEVAISCGICNGEGCRFCKESGWIEVMGCGMVHPQILRNGGIDPKRYCGWAFGLGVDRFALMKYGIKDIQLFFQNDLRFLMQF